MYVKCGRVDLAIKLYSDLKRWEDARAIAARSPFLSLSLSVSFSIFLSPLSLSLSLSLPLSFSISLSLSLSPLPLSLSRSRMYALCICIICVPYICAVYGDTRALPFKMISTAALYVCPMRCLM